MGLELILGEPHLADEGGIITRNKKIKRRHGFWSGVFSAFSSLAKLWNKIFVPRELFVRNEHGTTRIVFEKHVQVQIAVIIVGLVAWLSYSTSGVLLGKSSNKIMQERLAETHNAYENKISSLQKEYEELNLRIFLAEKEFSKISDELTKRHNHLSALIGMQERIGKTMKKRSAVQKKSKKNPKQSTLKPLRDHDNVLLTSRPAGPSHQNFPAIKVSLDAGLPKNKLRVGNKRIDKIAAHIENLDRRQRAILDHIDEHITSRVKNYQRAFAQTEAVKADLFAEQVAISSSQNVDFYNENFNSAGGPLVALSSPPIQVRKQSKQKPNQLKQLIVNGTGKNVYKVLQQVRMQINNLQKNIKNLNMLDKAIVYLPLSTPAQVSYITSAFGPRIDPFTREWAFHTGIDIAGKNNKIEATLPGRVVFAGNARGFGKLIEIDHGFGLVTRYAHLKKISVRKGSKVKFKQVIGLMGNTGRSTGEHLHYEIILNGKPYDPWRFMEAGNNVFETTQ